MLSKLFEAPHAGTEVARRVWTALDNIVWAYSNAESFPEPLRVVLLVTALESLLTSKSDRNKAKKIAEYVDTRLSDPRKRLYSRKTLNGKPFGGTDKHSRYGWWMRELILLRNMIVHGGDRTGVPLHCEFTRDDGTTLRESRYLRGLRFFDACLYECLVEAGVMTGTPQERGARRFLRVTLLSA